MIVRMLIISLLLCTSAVADEWRDASLATMDLYGKLVGLGTSSPTQTEAEVGFTKIRLGDGRYLQQHWAVALADYAKNHPLSELTARSWLADKGADTYACPLLASVLFNQALKARGGGYANTVTEEGWRTMATKLDQADEVLGTCGSRIRETLFWNIVRLRVTYSNDRLESLRQSHFDAVVAKWPDADEVYEPSLFKALPVWGGSVEEIEDIIQAATDRTKSRLKTVMYARLYQNLISQQGQLQLSDTKADWNKMKQSMADFRLLKEPDIGSYMNYVEFACQREDYAEVRLLLDSARQRYSHPNINERARDQVYATIKTKSALPCFAKALALPKPAK